MDSERPHHTYYSSFPPVVCCMHWRRIQPPVAGSFLRNVPPSSCGANALIMRNNLIPRLVMSSLALNDDCFVHLKERLSMRVLCSCSHVHAGAWLRGNAGFWMLEDGFDENSVKAPLGSSNFVNTILLQSALICSPLCFGCLQSTTR